MHTAPPRHPLFLTKIDPAKGLPAFCVNVKLKFAIQNSPPHRRCQPHAATYAFTGEFAGVL